MWTHIRPPLILPRPPGCSDQHPWGPGTGQCRWSCSRGPPPPRTRRRRRWSQFASTRLCGVILRSREQTEFCKLVKINPHLIKTVLQAASFPVQVLTHHSAIHLVSVCVMGKDTLICQPEQDRGIWTAACLNLKILRYLLKKNVPLSNHRQLIIPDQLPHVWGWGLVAPG